jgi:hypothetical protein
VSLPRNEGECHQKQNEKDKKQQPRFFRKKGIKGGQIKKIPIDMYARFAIVE